MNGHGPPLLVIQCCKDKGGTRSDPLTPVDVRQRLGASASILDVGQGHFHRHFDHGSVPKLAILRYDGHFYRTPGVRNELIAAVRAGRLDLLIMSAGYGFVHAFQPIKEYELEMKGPVTTYWSRAGLAKVLEEYVRRTRPSEVVGIFSQSAGYLKVFEGASWPALKAQGATGGAREISPTNVAGTAKVLRSQAGVASWLLANQFAPLPPVLHGVAIKECRLC